LVDASYLVALGYVKDRYHETAKLFATQNPVPLLIPDVVLVEAVYNIHRLGGTGAAVRVGRLLLGAGPNLVALTTSDVARAMRLMEDYRDIPLDFVDCCLTALAERLEITQIYTFDRRDFSIIRPAHVEYFELLP